MTEVSSIDEMLFTGKTAQQPATPEHQPEVESHKPEQEPETEYDAPVSEDHEDTPGEEPEAKAEPEDEPESELDDYGNDKPKAKTYTEDEVNERINKAVRDRLARMERNQQPSADQAKQAEQAGFEYDPDSSKDWQQQLEQFVEQTVTKMTSKKQQAEQNAREEQAHAEFEVKFHQSMSKFPDFRDVVSSQPITDAMTVATRAMKDPAAFLYAASKRHGAELQRIANIPDNYTQMVEMGRLEERMKKAKATTQAPKPVSKSRDNAAMPASEKNKQPTIEDLIAAADAKRLSIRNNRRR